MWVASKHPKFSIPDANEKPDFVKPTGQPFKFEGHFTSKLNDVNLTCDQYFIIDEKSPFLLFCLQIDTGYSRSTIKKKMDHFKELERHFLRLRGQLVL